MTTPSPTLRARPDRAAVASGHPAVTEAALALLEAGGNAVDAAVGAGFASALAEPALTSLGGGGFLLSRSAAGRARLYDFFVDTPGLGLSPGEQDPHFVPVTVAFPGSEQVFNVGLGSVAVPGNLKGLLHVHEREGRLPLKEVVAPAVGLAREGVRLNSMQGYFLQLLQPIMTLTAAGRALYQPEGRYLGEGELLRNPELAAFLEELPADRGRDFYEGELAGRIADELHAGQGLLTRADLARYAVVEREPLTARYRGHRLLTNPPPSFGGTLIALSLALMELAEDRPANHGDPQHLLRMVAVMEEVHRLREQGRIAPDVLGREERESFSKLLRSFTRGTTHVSVWDAEGNVASLTHSNGEGSGYLAPGTGIMLNNMLGEDDLHPEGFFSQAPGERVASMMSPSVVEKDGAVELVLGSGGSKRIRTALLQVIVNVLDFGLPLEEAVEHPRLHWDGEILQVEPGFESASLEVLRRRLPVNEWGQRDVYFGGVHAVARRGACAGDSRRGGYAAAVEEGR